MAFDNAGAFQSHGRDLLTRLAEVVDELDSYGRAFEARGGAVKMNLAEPELNVGVEVEGYVVLRNDLLIFLAVNERRRMLDRLRQDI